MNEEKSTTPVPDYSGENLKMPDNTDVRPAESPANTRSVSGPVLLILVVLLIAILVGLYSWFTAMRATPPSVPTPVTVDRPTLAENNEPESTTAEARTETTLTTSTSDELSAIEADLEATELEGLDVELDAIEAELDAAVQE